MNIIKVRAALFSISVYRASSFLEAFLGPGTVEVIDSQMTRGEGEKKSRFVLFGVGNLLRSRRHLR